MIINGLAFGVFGLEFRFLVYGLGLRVSRL
jgi:hypothetical protein